MHLPCRIPRSRWWSDARFIAPSVFAIFVGMASASDGSMPPYTPPQEDSSIVLSRQALIGTSSRVRKLAVSQGHGRHYQASLKELLVEERSAPKGCGIRAARIYRAEVATKFHVAASDTCFVSSDKVACPSQLLPGDQKIFFDLTYMHGSDDIDLSLTVRRVGLWGATSNARLAAEHVEWFEGLFDCLVSVAECEPELPLCAKAALAGGRR